MEEPKVRFKKDDGSSYPTWKEMPLGILVSDNLDPVPTPREGYRRVGIYCHAKGTFQEDVPAEKVLDVDTMYRIHKDNLIVNITFAWEHAVAIVKPEDEGLLVSHRFPEYSFNAGQVPGFYKYLVLRPYFRNQLSLASPGGAGRNRVLNKAQFKKIPVSVPCEEEQQKIADFLSSVDEVISTSEAVVKNLKTQKKAVMKKIFSQEVRFKRADGSDFPEWEEEELGAIALAKVGNKPDEIIEEKTEFEYINAGTTNSGYVNGYNRKGDVVTTPSRGQGGIGFVGYHEKAFWLGPLCYGIQSRVEHVMTKYLYFYLDNNSDCILDCVKTGSIPAVNQEDLIQILVSFPCLKEQRLIADFLSDFDEAIAAAKKELELWKELKKGLLQQMFV